LPIDDLLPSLRGVRNAVIEAAPGAGKTTRVPPVFLDDGQVIVLEPRRLAARMAAKRVASEMGESLGGVARSAGALAALAVAGIAAAVWWGGASDPVADAALPAPSVTVASGVQPSGVNLSASPRVTPSPDLENEGHAEGVSSGQGTNATPSATGVATAGTSSASSSVAATSNQPKTGRPKKPSKPKGTTPAKPATKPAVTKPKTGGPVDMGF
jgi:hypothetical protein